MKKKKNRIRRPNVSEASQFHQPPHEPSCIAHQLPKKSETKLNVLIEILFRFRHLVPACQHEPLF